MGDSNTSEPADDSPSVDSCPTREQIEGHREARGRELKPTGDCDDADPQGAEQEEEPQDPDDLPNTLAEAIALYDPDNKDPYTVIGRRADGAFFAMVVSTAVAPPDWVVTEAHLVKWVAELDQGEGDE